MSVLSTPMWPRWRSLVPSIAALMAAAMLVPPPSTSAISSSPVGVNYGLLGDNLPDPRTVLPLLRSIDVGRVRLYDPDPHVLSALSGTGVEIVLGVPDRCIPLVCDTPGALAWANSTLLPLLPAAKIVALAVGNEVLTSNDTARMRALAPAMRSLHAALLSLGLHPRIAVTTAHNLAVLARPSYPPSAAVFRSDLLPYICPILDFHAATASPFLINAYPYFAYRDDPRGVALPYALSDPDHRPAVLDNATGLRYTSMLHAQVDAVYAAISAASGAGGSGNGNGVEVRVSETGWPSAGDNDEAGATPQNAAKYNGNVMRMVAEGKGTPAKPATVLRVYMFALFNENLKPGPKSERNYGLFKPDGTPVYDLGIKPKPDNTSTDGGRAGGGDDGGSSDSGYYSVSAAPVARVSWSWWRAVHAGLWLV